VSFFRGRRKPAPDFFLPPIFLIFSAFPVFPFFRDSFRGAKFFLCGLLFPFFFFVGIKKIAPGRIRAIEFFLFLLAVSVFFEKAGFFYFFRLFVPFAIYFLISRFSGETKSLEKTIPVLVLMVALLSIIQYIFKVNPFNAPLPYATFGNPMYLGAWLALMLPLCFPRPPPFSKITPFGKGWAGPAAFALGLAALLLTGSQAAYLGFFAGLFYVCFRRKKIKIFLMVVFISGIFYFSFLKKGDGMFKDSFSKRKSYYKVALLMIKENPLKGIGLGNFRGQYVKYRVQAGLPFHAAPRWAHSDILHFFAELGAIRGAVIVFFILSVLFKKVAADKIPYKAGVISMVATSFLAFPFQRISTIIPFFIFAGIIMNKPKESPAAPHARAPRLLSGLFGAGALQNNAPLLRIIFMITAVFSLLYFLVFGYAQFRWKRGLEFFEKKEYRQAAVDLGVASCCLPENYEVLFDKARAEYRAGDFLRAVSDYKKCLKLYFDWDICYNLSLNFKKTGQEKMALKFLKIAEEINPDL